MKKQDGHPSTITLMVPLQEKGGVRLKDTCKVPPCFKVFNWTLSEVYRGPHGQNAYPLNKLTFLQIGNILTSKTFLSRGSSLSQWHFINGTSATFKASGISFPLCFNHLTNEVEFAFTQHFMMSAS